MVALVHGLTHHGTLSAIMTSINEQSESEHHEDKTVGRARKRLMLFITFGLIVGLFSELT